MGCCPMYPEPGDPVSMEPGHFPTLHQQVFAVVELDDWVDVLVEEVEGYALRIASLAGERAVLWHHHPFDGFVVPGHAARYHRTAHLLGWPGIVLNVRLVHGDVPSLQVPSPGAPLKVDGKWSPALPFDPDGDTGPRMP
ncbi:hypothetical protein [Nocardioides sp. GY 10127]|uniref:hypothetical protein n=1 Tax=Nocardioides sp. GY 10127 TaxID=2569762 RepID=UPI0010A8C95D|nr:hypothetical protein [Nocardioides sp. GY 10127]TIC84426.1 hypothetical protein E8D37_06585 [Nocardioides sp. GY 10127]